MISCEEHVCRRQWWLEVAQRPRLESVSGLSLSHSHPQQEGERWLHLCARSLLALFLVADAKCDKLHMRAFWCEVSSAGIGVSAVNSFISRSLAGREPRSKGQCFIHRNAQRTFNTSHHVRTSYALSSTTCASSSWKYHVRVTYVHPELTQTALLKKPVRTRGYSVVTFATVGIFQSPGKGRKEGKECN